MAESTADLSLPLENRSSVVGGVNGSWICFSGGVALFKAKLAGSWG
jgi:hypothetical protein